MKRGARSMTEVRLAKKERRQVRSIAFRLAEYHKSDSIQTRKAISGLQAEYAVIKFLNYELGAHPKIEFNTEYSDGGDGGFDFAWPDSKCTWDVKSTMKTYEKNYLTNTKAKFIIGVKKSGLGRFYIDGFMPTAKAKDSTSITSSSFVSLYRLQGIFPDNFIGPRSRPYGDEVETAGEILEDRLGLIALDWLAKSEGGKS